MRLRLTDSHFELAVLEARSETEFVERFGGVWRVLPDALKTSPRLEIHLWHGNAWWNLSEDLARYFAWRIETGQAAPDEGRRFAEMPQSRMDWLYAAARQMERLLDAASVAQPE